jgi:hypothetical protein
VSGVGRVLLLAITLVLAVWFVILRVLPMPGTVRFIIMQAVVLRSTLFRALLVVVGVLGRAD